MVENLERLVGAESLLHLEMKAAVGSKLKDDGYSVAVEPPFSPSRVLWWSSYRPDLLAFRRSDRCLQYMFAECETNPFAPRILRKRIDSAGWQSHLLEELQVRFLLVVPRGRLSRVCYPSIRKVWEIWTYERWSGAICVCPVSTEIRDISAVGARFHYARGCDSFEG